MTQAVLAAVDTFDGERIVVVREKVGEIGRSIMRVERRHQSGAWVPTSARITIPNQAVFLVRDALERSCQLAMGDRR